MADSLLSIGKTAVLANSRLLNTTGNNIANINTPGYVRQRTTFVAEQFGLGVGQGTTEPVSYTHLTLPTNREV